MQTQKTPPKKGNLREHSLPRLLVLLNREKKTGTLRVSTSLFTKKLYFISGNIIFASSDYEDDRLGEVLLKIGKINLEQYEKSVELLKKTGKRQGAILVELGYLTPKELFWSVKYQVQEIVYSLFQLEEGEYEFLENEVPPDEVITLKIGMGDLIYEGVKRINNWTRIQREMPPMDTVLSISKDRAAVFQEIKLDQADKEILSLVDGKRTIKEILNNSKQGSFTALKTLYVLYSIGILEETTQLDEKTAPSEDSKQSEPLSAEMKELIAEIEELHSKLNSLSAHELLGLGPDSTPSDAKKQYYHLAKRYHPDRYVQINLEGFKEKLTDIFDALTKAYRSIKDGTANEQSEVQPQEEQAPPEVPPEVQALRQFKRGIKEMKGGNYWLAAEAFRWATRLDPTEPKYWSYLSKALTHIPKRLKQAEEALLEAIKLDQYNSEYYSDLGNIYLKAGLKKRARRQFEKALSLDRSNQDAQQGLQALEEVG
ncbi:MAG: DUF4388 domain-containing protein [Nitrospirae bacterium]|nr:DUF4388 domain-containing protein [Nitrospirota bacterium]